MFSQYQELKILVKLCFRGICFKINGDLKNNEKIKNNKSKGKNLKLKVDLGLFEIEIIYKNKIITPPIIKRIYIILVQEVLRIKIIKRLMIKVDKISEINKCKGWFKILNIILKKKIIFKIQIVVYM